MNDTFEKYRQWAKAQSCSDCGRTKGQVKIDDGHWGWMTETQCYACWKTLGAPENRGLPGTEEIYLNSGLPPVW